MIPLLSPTLPQFPALDRPPVPPGSPGGLSEFRETSALGNKHREARSVSFEDALDRAQAQRDRSTNRVDADRSEQDGEIDKGRLNDAAPDTEGLTAEVRPEEGQTIDTPGDSVSSETTQNSESSGSPEDKAEVVAAGTSGNSTNRGAEGGGSGLAGGVIGMGGEGAFLGSTGQGPVGTTGAPDSTIVSGTTTPSLVSPANEVQVKGDQMEGEGTTVLRSEAAPNSASPVNTNTQSGENTASIGPFGAGAGPEVKPEIVAQVAPSGSSSVVESGGGAESRSLDSSNAVNGPLTMAGEGRGAESALSDDGSREGAARHSRQQILEKIQLERGSSGESAPATNRAHEVEQTVRLANAALGQNNGGSGNAGGMEGASLAGGQAAGSAVPAPVMQMVGSLGDMTAGQTLGESAREAAPPMTQRVVRGLSTLVNQNGGVMNMRLSPPELGDLRVQMTVVRSVVSVQFQASTPEAQAVLDKSISVLRTALESQGLTVERLTVQLNQSGNSGQAMAQDQGEQQAGQQQHDAGGASRGASRGHREDGGQSGEGREGNRDPGSLFSSLVEDQEMNPFERAVRKGSPA